MGVRLLRGNFFAPEGFAINDFESLNIGDITEASYVFIGTDQHNGCTWVGPSTFFQR